MIISATREEGIERVYVTRFASVLSYFTANDEGGGVRLHVEPGLTTYPSEFHRQKAGVRDAVLAEIAGRLGISMETVLQTCLSDLKKIADPELPEHFRYARRSKNRAQAFR